MTPKEQRIAIAEACGFERWKGDGAVWLCKPRDEKQRKYWLNSGSRVVDEPVDELRDVPDYCNDLNAMHEAEKNLSLDQRDTYWHRLARIAEKGRMATAAWLTATATAAQRAEAFLRTIGKWKYTP